MINLLKGMAMPPSARAGRNGALLAFGIALIYASLRYLFYARYPSGDLENWILRDSIMNGPRLLVLALSLHLGVRLWGGDGLGLHARKWKEAVTVLGVYCLVLWLPESLLRGTPYHLGARSLSVLAASSVLVGLWEEILYRGVFFNALDEWRGAKTAVWGSSFLFTIMHIQAQPLEGWPSIFLFGMVAALLRRRGVGLPWLIGFHALYDTLFMFGGAGESLIPGLPLLLFLLRIAYVVCYYKQTEHRLASSQTSQDVPKESLAVDGGLENPQTDVSPQPPVCSVALGIHGKETDAHHRLREMFFQAAQALPRPDAYRIRLHIAKVDPSGAEQDLGPWPDTVAQASRLEDATDLCSMLSHHLRGLLFRNSRSA